MPLLPSINPLVMTALLASCGDYDLFRLAGYAQEDFSNDADIVFVIDNSSSMQDEAEALALNFDVFIRKLTDPGEGGFATEGLADAVDNYINYVQRSGRFVDYQLAITTTDVESTYGDLYGDTPIIKLGDSDIAGTFQKNLLCSATCFNQSMVPSNPDYSSDEPVEEISQEYLNDVCGSNQWAGHCGSGQEEHLEALFMALCRATDYPPSECFEQNQFEESDVGSNSGMLRDKATLIPIIITDEGDTSRRLAQGDPEPTVYEQLYEKFGRRMAFAVIGPDPYSPCNTGGAVSWGVDRFQYLVGETQGRWFDIAEETEGEDGEVECGLSDFAAALDELGELLNSLLDTFPLQSVPDVETIIVFSDRKEVDRAQELQNEETGVTSFTDGWSYYPEENAIQFHGSAVPEYGAEVRIFYLPLDGMPRELPF